MENHPCPIGSIQKQVLKSGTTFTYEILNYKGFVIGRHFYRAKNVETGYIHIIDHREFE